MRCCGREHFGQCTEDPKCFICAGEHEGSKHECTAEGCKKRSGPCEHHVAKCANCEGPHPATSPRCPERRSSGKTRQQKEAGLRSSPPVMEPAAGLDDLSMEEDQAEMETTPAETAEQEQVCPSQVISISSDMSTPEPLPQDRPSARSTRELRPRTKMTARASQILSPDDLEHMSVDDDSDTA